MRVLMTGVKGQLGHDMVNELEKRDHVTAGVGIEEMGITDAASMERVIMEADMEAVTHCAAYTTTGAAENNVDVYRRVNADGTENVAEICGKLDIKMMYISTDYVFNGQGTRVWEPDDEREPLNVCGLTKCGGELAVEHHLSKYFIVHIAWMFDVNGENFIKTMLNLGKTHDSITVMDDQAGSPTYTYDLTRLLVDMVETERYSRYHATNEGLCSWYEFACKIFKQTGMKVTVLPVDSASYPSRAKRPMNSRMSRGKLEESEFERLPSWQDALSRYLQEIKY